MGPDLGLESELGKEPELFIPLKQVVEEQVLKGVMAEALVLENGGADPTSYLIASEVLNHENVEVVDLTSQGLVSVEVGIVDSFGEESRGSVSSH
ncbi:hypothetical protein ACOSQ2_019646 [Xanthoceras sorbifolium]